MKTTMMYFVFI